MFNKLAFAAHIFGIALWCGAATSGYTTDAPAPTVVTVSASGAHIQRNLKDQRYLG